MIIAVFEILGHDGDCGMGLLGFGEIAMADGSVKNKKHQHGGIGYTVLFDRLGMICPCGRLDVVFLTTIRVVNIDFTFNSFYIQSTEQIHFLVIFCSLNSSNFHFCFLFDFLRSFILIQDEVSTAMAMIGGASAGFVSMPMEKKSLLTGLERALCVNSHNA